MSGFLDVLHFGKMRVSMRGKFIEYVCTDPRTQRELLPGNRNIFIFIIGFRGLSRPLSSLGPVGSRTYPQVGGTVSWLAWPGLPAFYPESSHQWNGKEWAASMRGGLNPGQKGYYPLVQLQISRFWKQMVQSATQITVRKYNEKGNRTYLLCQQIDRFSPLTTWLQDTVSINCT